MAQAGRRRFQTAFRTLIGRRNNGLKPESHALQPVLKDGRNLFQVRAEAEGQVVNALHERLVRLLGGLLQTSREIAHARHKLSFHGHGTLGGDRRRSGTEVRHVIAQCRVGLVTNGTDHRNPGCGHGTHNGFLVEGPQVLHRSAAASHDQHVWHPCARVEILDSGDDLRRRALALHLHGEKADLKIGETAREDRAHVVDHGAGG